MRLLVLFTRNLSRCTVIQSKNNVRNFEVRKANKVVQFPFVFPQQKLVSGGLDIVVHLGNERIFTMYLFVKTIQMTSHKHKER